MGIVEEDIARVRAATDFVALAGEHLALKRVGLRWSGLCPFHTEKSPSFSINAEDGLYYCFGCQAKGDVITFVRELQHLDFAEAVEMLAARAGITLRYDDAATGRDHQRLTRIHETVAAAVAWYHDQLLSSRDHGAGAARHYLRHERGYDPDIVRHYQLGWAPEGWDHLLRALRVPADALIDAGLAQLSERGRPIDFFRGRLLFPIFDPGGRPIGAGGRILPGGRGPKYKNTAGTAVYDKSKVLYGLNWAKADVVRRGQIVVCEGYTDVIGLQLAGVGEAVATCGTALADGHIRLLTKFARRIVLAYDADAAGQAAADRFYDWEQRYEVDIRVAALPGGSDPADLARNDPAALEKAIAGARPFLAFRLDRLFARADLGTAEGRVRAATDALAAIAAHPNALVRDQYLMEVADRCRIDPDRLRALPAPPAGDGAGAPRREPGDDARRARPGEPRPADGGSRPARRPGPDGGPDADGLAPVRVPLPELMALRLAVHRRDDVVGRMHAALFGHPLSRAAFVALTSGPDVHAAIESSGPQTADLLARLAVEEIDEDPDDVMVRLVEEAGGRALAGLNTDMRAAPAAHQGDYARSISWLKLALEALRTEDGMPVRAAPESDGGAERLLVAWLVARDEAMRDDGLAPSGAPDAA